MPVACGDGDDGPARAAPAAVAPDPSLRPERDLDHPKPHALASAAALAVSVLIHAVALSAIVAALPIRPPEAIETIPIEVVILEEQLRATAQDELKPLPLAQAAELAATADEPPVVQSDLPDPAPEPVIVPIDPAEAVLPTAPDIEVPLPEPITQLAVEMMAVPGPSVQPEAALTRPAPRPTPPVPQRQSRREQDARPRTRPVQTPPPQPRRAVTQSEQPRRESQPARRSSAQANTARPAGPTAAMVSSYRSLIAAELNRRKSYPEAARAQGLQGRVVVAFTINSSGRVTSQSIAGSSGHTSLDAAARAAVSRMVLPPPPGGHLTSSAALRFTLGD